MDKSSHEKSKPIILLGTSLITFGCVLAVTSLAWFCPPQSNASVTGMKGEATGSYFESGTGKEGDPYIIANAKQLYYFNWLQDLGYFNEVDETAKEIPTTYFKIKDGVTEMDAGNYILPPAGTSENPFVGNFDGNGCVVKNLTISNSWEELKSTKPAQAKQNGNILESSEIVGFFGIVGEYVTDISYEPSANAVKDLYFDNLTVKSAATNVLAGFIAGYANGTIDNCGIHCGQFSFVNGATALTGTKLEGKSLSRFTLIGDYDETSKNFVWTGQPTSSGGSSGTESSWGGSIDMRTMNRRLSYIMNTDPNVKMDGSYLSSSRTDIKLNAQYNYSYYGGEYYWKANSYNNTCYLMNGTCLPLNVDLTAMGLNSDSEITVQAAGVTLHANEQYKGATSETVSKSNTGYLVSYSTYRGDSWVRSGIRTFAASAYYSGIPDSFSGDTYEITYDENTKKQFAMYTIQGNTTYCIIDDVNKDNYAASATNKTYADLGLTKYKNVRSNFDATMNGAQVYHGFHFMQKLPNDAVTTNLTSYTVTQSASILGNAYESYEFIKGALNFTVEKDGRITAIVGSGYAGAGSGNSLFDLYKAERDGNHKITSLTRISQVYTDANGNVAYNSKPSDDYSLSIDIKTLASTSNKLSKDAAYYFEIPVTAGDYVIGTASSSGANNAYFMYLDIGANGAESKEDTTISNTNIDFVYKENGALAKITDEGYTPSGVVFSIGGPSTSAGLIYFKRETKNNKDEGGVVYVGVAYYTATGCSITPAGNGKSTNKEPDED